MNREQGQADGAGEGARSSDADLARRLERLSQTLDVERREHAEVARSRETGSASYGAAYRLASEFVAGVLVGAGLGWGVDRLAGTAPWGLVIFLLLGFAAGVVNAIRSASNLTQSSADADGHGGGKPH
ncbi:AtpZ/AtpI family protein [Faunimonas pinastri]|nr:AtpZ/AtpI family protein [Faunimonas pinastri]